MFCKVCQQNKHWKIKGLDICCSCQKEEYWKEIRQYIKEHPEFKEIEHPENETYGGGPMVSSETEMLSFIIREYGIEHILVYLKNVLNPEYWKYLRVMCILDKIPNYDLYSDAYTKISRIENWDDSKKKIDKNNDLLSKREKESHELSQKIITIPKKEESNWGGNFFEEDK
jgi:hypothetical protein